MPSELQELSQQIRSARRNLDQKVGEARALGLSGKRLQAEVAELKAQHIIYEQAAAVLSSIGEERQAAAQNQIETLVTKGLQAIFEENLTFHVVQSVRAKTPTVDFVVRSHLEDGRIVETEIMSSRGGGLASVVGLLLRIVVLLLSPDKQETVLFLDETLGMLSVEYEGRIAEFLREIVDKTGLQIVMITHSTNEVFPEVADKKYRFELVDGVTKVKEL